MKCTLCDNNATYGYSDKLMVSHCVDHKIDGMVRRDEVSVFKATNKDINIKRMEYMKCNKCQLKSTTGIPDCKHRVSYMVWKCPCRDQLYPYAHNIYKHVHRDIIPLTTREKKRLAFHEDKRKKRRLVNELNRISIVNLI